MRAIPCDIAAKINLKCPILLDQLSYVPVAGAASSRATTAPKAAAAAQAAQVEEVIDENDFDFGD